MKYSLINYGTGEIYTTEGENITCQYLYKRALHCRRETARYGHALDDMRLLRVTGENSLDGVTIEEWQGGLSTPIEDLRLYVRTYYSLKRRNLDTVGLVLEYIKQNDIFHRLPQKALYDLAKALKPYDETTVGGFIRRINLRRIKMPL